MDRPDPADERVDVVPTTATRDQWDEFAQECGSSFWSARRGHRMWQWKFHARYRTRLLDILLVTRGGERYKVGQCAVGIGRRFRVFSDGLQLRRGSGAGPQGPGRDRPEGGVRAPLHQGGVKKIVTVTNFRPPRDGCPAFGPEIRHCHDFLEAGR